MRRLAVAAIACGLMWTGGFVDALGFLTLRHVYLGNMTGDTVRLGLALGRGDWADLVTSATPILSFGAGLLLGSIVQDISRRLAVRRLLAVALTMEAACLAALWLLPGWANGTRVFLGGAAMGIQNTSLRNSGVLPLYTTHVTGLFTDLAEHVSAVIADLFGVGHRHRPPEGAGGGRSASRRREMTAAGWLALLYGLWVLGALTCGETVGWGRVILLFPIALVLGAAAIDAVRPLTTVASTRLP